MFLEFSYFNKARLGVSSGKLWLSWAWGWGGLEEKGRHTQSYPEAQRLLASRVNTAPGCLLVVAIFPEIPLLRLKWKNQAGSTGCPHLANISTGCWLILCVR